MTNPDASAKLFCEHKFEQDGGPCIRCGKRVVDIVNPPDRYAASAKPVSFEEWEREILRNPPGVHFTAEQINEVYSRYVKERNSQIAVLKAKLEQTEQMLKCRQDSEDKAHQLFHDSTGEWPGRDKWCGLSSDPIQITKALIAQRDGFKASLTAAETRAQAAEEKVAALRPWGKMLLDGLHPNDSHRDEIAKALGASDPAPGVDDSKESNLPIGKDAKSNGTKFAIPGLDLKPGEPASQDSIIEDLRAKLKVAKKALYDSLCVLEGIKTDMLCHGQKMVWHTGSEDRFDNIRLTGIREALDVIDATLSQPKP